MKVIILSDTHGSKKNMDNIIPTIKESIDLIIHAGDHFKDSVYLSEKSGKPVIAVAGNCDYENVEDEVEFEIENVRFFLTHGHRHRVKYDLGILAEYAKEKEADIAVFGHTHIKANEVVSGVQILNPGSLSQPRDGLDGSYVIMEIENCSYSFEYFNVKVLSLI